MFRNKKEKKKENNKEIFFDMDLFLDANLDIQDEIEKGTYSNIESYIKSVDVVKMLEEGKVRFHSLYEPFEEEKYLTFFPDVKTEIDKGNFKSAFHHFKLFGYQEILDSKRIWQKTFVDIDENALEPSSDTKKKESPNPSFSLKEKVKGIYTNNDSFYAYTLMTNINSIKYLEANPDVQHAVETGSIGSHIDHLLYNGTNDIITGSRKAYLDVDLTLDIQGAIDQAIVTSNNSLYIDGWFFIRNSWIREVYLSNGIEGIRITENICNYPRIDLEKPLGDKYSHAGFYCYVESDLVNIEKSTYYELVIITEDGLTKQIPMEAQENTNRNAVSQVMLAHLQINKEMQKNLDNCTGIALQTYLKRHELKILKDDIAIETYGPQIEKPKVTLIVPLYGRIDFVEFQLSQFANDIFFKENAELIYVLDDPRLEKDLTKLCHNIYPVFEIPFRVINTYHNCGYAMANNIGASFASAELVLFFNSDLFPTDHIWLKKLLDLYNVAENIGTICPKLVFEDGAIQHAGMIFQRDSELNMWLNEHPGKGLPDMNLEIEIKSMPAVTGACMLINKALYKEVGGMSENYFLGDFEDSDLCLKLSEKGYVNYYAPSVKLCHLERQSQSLFSDMSWKGKVTLYNAWQHERKWAHTISKIMETHNAQ